MLTNLTHPVSPWKMSTSPVYHNIFCPSVSLPSGGSLSGDLVTDEELFIRWLEIAAFLPVISFHTPPWVCGEDRVYNHKAKTHYQPFREPHVVTINTLYPPLLKLFSTLTHFSLKLKCFLSQLHHPH